VYDAPLVANSWLVETGTIGGDVMAGGGGGGGGVDATPPPPPPPPQAVSAKAKVIGEAIKYLRNCVMFKLHFLAGNFSI
jgi:hypothetical protein